MDKSHTENSTESGLRCPNCEYNLTGLRDDRCPECGAAFDRAALLGQAVGVATPWDRKPSLGSYLATWWLASAHPGRFARGFPKRHDEALAGRYARLNHLLAVGCLALPAAASGHDAVIVASCIVLPVWIGIVFVEWALAGYLADGLAEGLEDRRRFWRGITRYSSGYSVVTGVICGAALFTGGLPDMAHDERFAIFLLIAALAFVLWCHSMGVAVCFHSTSRASRIANCFVIPLFGLGAVVVSLFVFFAWVWVARFLLRHFI